MILQLWPETIRNVRLRTPLAYFQTHFSGTSMRRDWTAPMVEVCAPKSRAKDFVSWLLSAPVVSSRAREVLEPLIESDVEFLPLLALRGEQYWAVNVTRVVDCLDLSSSQVVYAPEDGRPVNIHAYRFVAAKVSPRLIFKVPEPSAVFVQRELAVAIREARLSGVRFVDPAANQISDIMHGGPFDLLPAAPRIRADGARG